MSGMEYRLDTARDCTDEYRSLLVRVANGCGETIADLTDVEGAEQMVADLNDAATLRERVRVLEESAAAVVAAWDEDEIGQVDGELIDALRLPTTLEGAGGAVRAQSGSKGRAG